MDSDFVANISDTRFQYYAIVLITFCTYTLIYKFISPRLSRHFYKGYDQLSDFQKRDWNTRGQSTVNAILTSSLCIYILIYDEEMNTENIWAAPRLPSINISLLTGYILSDLVVIFAFFPLSDSISYSLHHLAAVGAYIYSLTFSGLVYFANFRVLAEVSTPFVNLRWILSTIGVKKSNKLFIINGLLMVFVFFTCRILSMPYYYYHMIAVWRSPIVNTLSFPMQVSWITASAVLDILNLYWFKKMFNGAIKIIKENSKVTSEEQIYRKREKGK